MSSARDQLRERFHKAIEEYRPNWETIAKTNQSLDNLSEYAAYSEKVEAFCTAIQHIRKMNNLSVEQMGERLGYSRQYVYKIEKKQIKGIPFDKIDFISEVFSVSPAYLLGLIEKEDEFPDPTAYYFWEYPNNPYIEIKDELIKQSLTSPMYTFGNPKEQLLSFVSNELINDYTLLYSLKKIFQSDPLKKNFVIESIKKFAELL